MLTWLVRSAMVAYYPRTDALLGVEDCGVDEFLAKVREETSRLMWFGIVMSAIVFHLTPLLTVFVPLPAFMLSPRTLDRHAHALATTNVYLLRQIAFISRLYAAMCWGAHPEVRKRFGLPPLAPDPGTWRSS